MMQNGNGDFKNKVFKKMKADMIVFNRNRDTSSTLIQGEEGDVAVLTGNLLGFRVRQREIYDGVCFLHEV